MIGALNRARDIYSINSILEPYQLVLEILKETGINTDQIGVATYNDTIAITKTEVIEVFNRAIQLAKLRERQ